MTASPKVHGDRPQEGSQGHGAATQRYLIAMTRDPALVHALQELADGDMTILLVEDLRRLADELMQHATAIALLDAQALGVPADAAVDAVKNQFPDVRLMVAGQATEQNVLATRIAQQKVFRFVHKPASPQRLKLLLDAASNRPAERRAAAAAAVEAPVVAGATPPPRVGSSPLPIIAAVAGVLVLAVAGWLLMRKDEKPAATAAVAAPAAVPAEVATLLERADKAFAAGALIAADGTSAAELYREVTRLDAQNATAIAGFERSIDKALTGAEQALLAGKLDQARVTAELARLIVPDNSRLAFLYTQIERELARINADTSQRQALENKQAQIRSAVNAVEQRIQKGALIEPATDSAMSRFREAQVLGGGDPMVRSARDSLVGALLTAADKELDSRRTATARRLVDAAGSVNSSAPGLDIMRRRVEEASAPAPASEAARATAPAQPEPAVPAVAASANTTGSAAQPAGAAPAAVPGDGVVAASTLRAIRRVDPEYPEQALAKLASGWVEMEFTVAKDGTVQDVVVTQSEPRRTFDSAAMSAMKRYRYAPVLRDGQPVEQRARLRMRFTAQDAK